jgi:hypothetical protein
VTKTGNLKRRGTPVVAARNAAAALDNIRNKRDLMIRILEAYDKSEDSINALRALPKSIRQFNLWAGGSESLGLESSPCRPWNPNSNQTLRAHSEVRVEVQKLVDAIRKFKGQQSPSHREETVKGLQVRLRNERDLNAIANRELLRSRVQLSELRDRYDVLKYAKLSSGGEAKRMIEELQSSVLKLEEENAGLKKRLGKAGLRRV